MRETPVIFEHDLKAAVRTIPDKLMRQIGADVVAACLIIDLPDNCGRWTCQCAR